ncbi:MAG: glycosyltransferase family 4 protein [Candidatus Promineifilaceae bacterium]
MKVGLVSGEFPPMQGGVGAFSQKLAEALASQGHEVHVVTSHQARPGATRRSMWDVKEPFTADFGCLHPVVKRWGPAALSSVAAVVQRYQLDVVNLQYQAAAYGMWLPAIGFLPWRLRGLAQVAVTFHDLRVPYLFPKAGRLRRQAVAHLARNADGAIATNKQDYAALEALAVRRLAHISIGSNIRPAAVSAEKITALRERLGLRPENCLVGYFGFLHPSKGAQLLVDALSRLERPLHLIFIGGRVGSSDSANSQNYARLVEERVASLNLAERVHWTGFLSEAETSLHLQACDVMAMPYRDGASLRRGTLMAVLAHARPVITTEPAGPLPELAHGKNAWLLPVDDVEALQQALEALAADAELRQRLGQGAGRLGRTYSWQQIGLATAEFYTQLLAE